MLTLNVLGYVWALPTTILFFILFFLPMWAFRQARFVGWRDGAFEWAIIEGSFFDKIYGGSWAATTLGFNIIFTARWLTNPSVAVHERHHIWQNKVFGPFFTPLYILGYLAGGIIWMFGGGAGLSFLESMYWNNPFEADARNYTKSKLG